MNIKKLQVSAMIALSLVYAVGAPMLYPELTLFWIVIGIFSLIAILSKNWVDLLMVLFVGANMVMHLIMYPNLDDTRHIAQVTALCALMLLQVTLLIGPLTRINKRFSGLFRHRRHVGVASFLLAFIHANFIIAKYYEYNLENVYGINANFFGSTALIILSAMAFTSTNYFQTKLPIKIYNLLHTGLLAFYVLYTLALVGIGYLTLDNWQYMVIIAFMIFWLTIAPWALPKKLFLRVNAWKQLHYLVYIAYIAVIIHAWTGFFVLAALPMQITLWVSVLIVFSVHLYGWIVRFRRQKAVPQSNPSPVTSNS